MGRRSKKFKKRRKSRKKSRKARKSGKKSRKPKSRKSNRLGSKKPIVVQDNEGNTLVKVSEAWSK